MPTTRELIGGVLGHLETGQRPQVNKLASAVTAGDTSLTLSFDLTGIAEGSVLGIELEEVHVWAVNTSTKVASPVERGWNSSTAAAHAINSLVFVNPKFSWYRILRAINDELRSLSSQGLFRMKTVDRTYSATVQGYDLAADFLSMYQVNADTPGPDKSWPTLDSWKVVRNASPSEFSSGFGLILYDAAHPGQGLRIQYKAAFSALSSLSDDLTTVSGLRAEAADIVEMGAALRLAAGRPIKRSSTENQGDTRRAEEVSTTDVLQAPGRLSALYKERVSQERARLMQEYPLAA